MAEENENKHDQKPSIIDKITEDITEGYYDGKHEAEEDERARAAAKIQNVWRRKNRARLQAEYLSSELRWRVRGSRV